MTESIPPSAVASTATTPPLIFAAMVKAMASIGHIGKDRKNTQQNYSFRGIDDLYNAVHPALVDAQIFICPSVVHRDHQERDSKSGGVLFYETLTVEHRFYASDGSFVTVTTMGSAMDSGDKAVNKAMSAAMKYALLEAFAIPTEGDNDTENHTPEVTPRRQPEPARPAAAAPAAAKPAPAKPAPTFTPVTPVRTEPVTAANAGKQDCEDVYHALVGNNGLMHRNYTPLVKSIWSAAPTFATRWENLTALQKAVRQIIIHKGEQGAKDVLQELTLGMTIDREKPSAEDGAAWFLAICQLVETGAVPSTRKPVPANTDDSEPPF